jgi:hypothetical protein
VSGSRDRNVSSNAEDLGLYVPFESRQNEGSRGSCGVLQESCGILESTGPESLIVGAFSPLTNCSVIRRLRYEQRRTIKRQSTRRRCIQDKNDRRRKDVTSCRAARSDQQGTPTPLIAQLPNRFPIPYGTRRFPRALHWSPSSVRAVQSTAPHPIS